MKTSGILLFGADLVQRFEKEYNVSDRKLGSGACGAVFMAIKQSRRTQLACKIVDLRRLSVAPRTQASKCESRAAAEDVNCWGQKDKIKRWAEKEQNENHLEGQLEVYHREASILAALSHVKQNDGHDSSDATLTFTAAKHHWYRKSLHHR